MADKKQILVGRKAIDAYRADHSLLHEKPYYRQVHDDHTPLLNKMVGALGKLGFNSLEEFFDTNKEYCLSLSGYKESNAFQQRLDLWLANNLVGEYGQVKIDIVKGLKDACARLFVGGECLMVTNKLEHASMAEVLKNCPNNAKIFIAGFGLGLILFYLLEAQKASKIVICEAQSNLAEVVNQKALPMLRQRYPIVEFQIVRGDAFELIKEYGKFDWIFFDTGETEREIKLAQTIEIALTEQGAYTRWVPYELEWR